MKSVTDEINRNQFLIIKRIKKYLKELKKDKIDTSKSSFCNFSTYSESPGFFLVKLWIKKINQINFLLGIFKNIYSIFYISNYKTTRLSKINFNNVVLTWGRSKDFSKNIFKDNYSNTKSNLNKKTLFFVIYLDKILPENIPDNVILYFREKERVNLFFFLNYFLITLTKNNFSIKKLIHYFSQQTIFAEQLLKQFFLSVDMNNLEKIIMPYEGQCFQNLIYKEVSKFNNKIKTIGFINAMVPALPINLIKRDGSPKILYLSGEAQLDVFNKYLNWKRKNLKIINSFRILKKINKNNLNSIFFPITLKNHNQVLVSLENFIKSKKDKSLNYLKIRKHPSNIKNKDQIRLYKEIDELLRRNSKKFSSKSKRILNIYIGPTSSFIQYLVNGIETIHITTDPIFETYTFALWKNLYSKKIDENMFVYSLVKNNKLIRLNNKNNNLINSKII